MQDFTLAQYADLLLAVAVKVPWGVVLVDELASIQ